MPAPSTAQPILVLTTGGTIDKYYSVAGELEIDEPTVGPILDQAATNVETEVRPVVAIDSLDMTDEQWSRVLDVTLNGTFRCTRAAVRLFREQGGGGVVVNNASVVGWRAQAGQAHYAAAKAGVMALTRCAAIDAAHLGVRINAVAPSLVMHPHLAKVTDEQTLAELTAREAFGRSAQPWEVATVVVFLASDHASYLTGEVISASSQHP